MLRSCCLGYVGVDVDVAVTAGVAASKWVMVKCTSVSAASKASQRRACAVYSSTTHCSHSCRLNSVYSHAHTHRERLIDTLYSHAYTLTLTLSFCHSLSLSLNAGRHGVQLPHGLLRAVRQVQFVHSELCDVCEYWRTVIYV